MKHRKSWLFCCDPSAFYTTFLLFFMKNFCLFFLQILLLAFANHTAFAKNTDPTSFYNNFNEVKLNDQTGKAFSTDYLDGKITLFNFIYTECASVCSVQTSQLLKVYQSLSPELKKDIRFVSVSLDPIKDNPKKLKVFADRLGANVAGWYFLSTNFHDLNRLTTKISLFKEEHGKTIYDAAKLPSKNTAYKLEEHSTGLWLIDKNGLIMQRYVGSPVDTQRLTEEFKILHQLQFKN